MMRRIALVLSQITSEHCIARKRKCVTVNIRIANGSSSDVIGLGKL